MTRQAFDRPDEADPRLTLYADRLNQIYRHELELPLPQFRTQEQHALHAFERTARRYEIPQQYFLELAEGLRSDLNTLRYATWNSLEKHCRGTGGVIALVVCAVMGLTNSGAAAQAVSMGNGIRLTHILRDIGQDWDRGHVYLPLEDLVRFGYREKDLAARIVNDAFVKLMRFEVGLARQLLRFGAEGICWLGDEGSRLTASAAVLHHIGILDAIERQGYDVFKRRPGISTAQKFRQLSAAWRLARRGHDEPLPARIWSAP
jgi:phytoene synthase